METESENAAKITISDLFDRGEKLASTRNPPPGAARFIKNLPRLRSELQRDFARWEFIAELVVLATQLPPPKAVLLTRQRILGRRTRNRPQSLAYSETTKVLRDDLSLSHSQVKAAVKKRAGEGVASAVSKDMVSRIKKKLRG